LKVIDSARTGQTLIFVLWLYFGTEIIGIRGDLFLSSEGASLTQKENRGVRDQKESADRERNT
jgi:hypothetical protein